VTATVKCCK